MLKIKSNLADDTKVCIILHFLFTFEELYYRKHFNLNSKVWLMHSIWYQKKKKRLHADVYKEIQLQVQIIMNRLLCFQIAYLFLSNTSKHKNFTY